MILKNIGKGLLGRLLSSGVLALGFWLMFQAFQRSLLYFGLLAAPTIIGGMYLMVKFRSIRPTHSTLLPADNSIYQKEETPGDSLDGSDKSNQLSP